MTSPFSAEFLRPAFEPFLDLSTQFEDRACVAVLLRPGPHNDLEIGFIRRAEAVGDRWSGQLAFPGGRREDDDVDDTMTVLREVREELAFDLNPIEKIGRLDDVQARRRGETLDFFIRPLVFFVERPVDVVPSPSEVADFFWVRRGVLEEPERSMEIEWRDEATVIVLPAIRLGKGPPLWGLTLSMTSDLLQRLRTILPAKS